MCTLRHIPFPLQPGTVIQLYNISAHIQTNPISPTAWYSYMTLQYIMHTYRPISSLVQPSTVIHLYNISVHTETHLISPTAQHSYTPLQYNCTHTDISHLSYRPGQLYNSTVYLYRYRHISSLLQHSTVVSFYSISVDMKIYPISRQPGTIIYLYSISVHIQTHPISATVQHGYISLQYISTYTNPSHLSYNPAQLYTSTIYLYTYRHIPPLLPPSMVLYLYNISLHIQTHPIPPTTQPNYIPLQYICTHTDTSHLSYSPAWLYISTVYLYIYKPIPSLLQPSPIIYLYNISVHIQTHPISPTAQHGYISLQYISTYTNPSHPSYNPAQLYTYTIYLYTQRHIPSLLQCSMVIYIYSIFLHI